MQSFSWFQRKKSHILGVCKFCFLSCSSNNLLARILKLRVIYSREIAVMKKEIMCYSMIGDWVKRFTIKMSLVVSSETFCSVQVSRIRYLFRSLHLFFFFASPRFNSINESHWRRHLPPPHFPVVAAGLLCHKLNPTFVRDDWTVLKFLWQVYIFKLQVL